MRPQARARGMCTQDAVTQDAVEAVCGIVSPSVVEKRRDSGDTPEVQFLGVAYRTRVSAVTARAHSCESSLTPTLH